MKQVYRYDEETKKYVEPVLIGDDEAIPPNCTEKELMQPNYKPVFNEQANDWVETITQEELDELMKPVIIKSDIEVLRDENAELKLQIEQQNRDMQSFMDYILGQLGGN